jgi:hypothetical protein
MCIYQLLSLICCKWYVGSFVFFIAEIANASKDWDNVRLSWLWPIECGLFWLQAKASTILMFFPRLMLS